MNHPNDKHTTNENEDCVRQFGLEGWNDAICSRTWSGAQKDGIAMGHICEDRIDPFEKLDEITTTEQTATTAEPTTISFTSQVWTTTTTTTPADPYEFTTGFTTDFTAVADVVTSDVTSDVNSDVVTATTNGPAPEVPDFSLPLKKVKIFGDVETNIEWNDELLDNKSDFYFETSDIVEDNLIDLFESNYLVDEMHIGTLQNRFLKFFGIFFISF